MADIKKIATRDSYGNALKELGAVVSDLVVLDADLAGATKTSVFQKAFPERHFDAGIAEANMCSEEFVQKYQMRGDDNQVLVMMECRQR